MSVADQTSDGWRICCEDKNAKRYVNADGRRKKEYEKAAGVIIADPCNKNQHRQRIRLRTKRFRRLGSVWKYRVNSGWRFVYRIDPDSKCIDVLYAGPHDDANDYAHS